MSVENAVEVQGRSDKHQDSLWRLRYAQKLYPMIPAPPRARRTPFRGRGFLDQIHYGGRITQRSPERLLDPQCSLVAPCMPAVLDRFLHAHVLHPQVPQQGAGGQVSEAREALEGLPDVPVLEERHSFVHDPHHIFTRDFRPRNIRAQPKDFVESYGSVAAEERTC